MSQLKNEISWSNSRANTFTGCRRQYYYNYYGSWDGWYKNADPFRRQCYILKNMTSLPMFIGTVVHNIIELCLGEFQNTDNQTSFTTEDLQAKAQKMLTQGFNQSLGTAWENNPKKNIHFIEHHQEKNITADERTEFKQKAFTCLANFCNLFPKLFPSRDKVEFLELEDFQSFELNTGEKVMVKLDCGIKINNRILLLDWKTGKRSDAIEDQMSVYTMYAMKRFDFS